MNKVSQRQATVNTLLAVLHDRGVDYEINGSTAISEVLNSDDKAKTREILFTMFKSGEVEYKESFQAKVDDDTELKSYISGLVNNWIRKAKELNCGESYKPKNPGSRAGSTDPQIKEMRKLLSVTDDAEAKVAIQSAIDARLSEIKASKQEVTIDKSQIPAELLEKLGL